MDEFCVKEVGSNIIAVFLKPAKEKVKFVEFFLNKKSIGQYYNKPGTDFISYDANLLKQKIIKKEHKKTICNFMKKYFSIEIEKEVAFINLTD